MKAIISMLSVVLLMMIVQVSVSQSLSDTLESYIAQGDAARLSGYFDDSIDIGLPYADKDYSRQQGERVMDDFFTRMPPDSFQIKETGSTGKNNHFMIGEYLTGKKIFTVLIMFHNDDGHSAIHKIKFEEKKQQP
jgi:hypothetical protein